MGQTGVGFVALYQLFPKNVTFAQLTDRPDGFNFWFCLEPKYGGMGDFQVKFIATTAHEVAYVFDPDPRLLYSNQTFRTDLSLYGYPGGVWYHFQRNLLADWQTPVTVNGTTRPGFSPSEVLYRIEIDAIGFEESGSSIYYSETAWVDDVNVYMNLPPDLPPSARFSATPSNPSVREAISFDASASSDADGTISVYQWNFGDGTSGVGAQSSHSYDSTGTFNATLTVIDDRGSNDTTTQSVQVGPSSNRPPIVKFTITPSQPVIGESVSFDASSSIDPDQGDSIQSYDWSFGDGAVGSGVLVSHIYTFPSMYDVVLTVGDGHGASNSTQQSMFVTRIPYMPGVEPGEWARYTISGNVPLASNLLLVTLNFTGAVGTNVTYTGDSLYFNRTQSSQSLWQNLLSFRVFGLMASNLSTGDFPWADSPYAINSTVAETFLGAARQANIVTVPFLGGTFSATWDQATGILLVLDENFPGTQSGETMRLKVELADSNIWAPTGNRSPVPVFSWTPSVPRVNSAVLFDGSKSYDPDPGDSTIGYTWNFGDGTSQDTVSPTIAHSYVTPGFYNASLQVNDNNGASAVSFRSITVQNPIVHDVAIIQVLSLSSSALIGQAVSIQVTLSNPGDTVEAVNVTVTSGNLSLAPAQNVTILDRANMVLRFKWNTTGFEPGPYAVRARASVVPGETNTADNQREGGIVTLFLPLSVHAAANPNSGIAPLRVSFTSTVSGGIPPYTYSWDFGDGSTSIAPDPTHQYDIQGEITTRLTVRDSQSLGTSTQLIVNVLPPLVVTVTSSPQTGQAPLDATFTASASGGMQPYRFVWTFDDGGTGPGPQVVHNYPSQGSYTATVTVTDAQGNTVHASSVVTVTETLGTLRIFVRDPSGTAVPDAWILITQVPNGQERPPAGSTLTDGSAVFPYLLPGVYEYTVIVGGYEVKVQSANVTAGPQTTESVAILTVSHPRSSSLDYTPYIVLATASLLVITAILAIRKRRMANA